MANNLYYNQSTYDSRTGGGYGKSQKLPSLGTGLGSERPIGSSDTGIYLEPSEYDITPEEQAEFEEETFGDTDDIDRFVSKINRWRPRFDISRRADRGSFAGTSNRYDLAEVSKMPTAKKGMVPFSSRALYPKGFDGGAIGTGGSGQAFKTTGNYRRTGTQYGTSRAPILDIEDEYIHYYSLQDLLGSDEDRALEKNKARMRRLRNEENQDLDDDLDFVDNND